MENTNGVDTNWQRYKGMSGAIGTPLIELEAMAENDFYEMGCFAVFLSGEAKGRRVYFNEHHDNTIAIAEHFGCDDMMDIMELIKPGDEILLDNSDYIAATDYHLHALPKGNYSGYSSCYNKDGTPKYVQRDVVANFSGSAPMTGDFSCKMIVEHTYCDESAFPYQGDWYKRLVYQTQGEEAERKYRLQYIDNALHDDRAEPQGVEQFFVTNLSAIYQCLLDCIDWVEKGIEPPKESQYSLQEGEFTVSEYANERCGIQNVCRLTSGGERKVSANVGENVPFEVNVQIPDGCGTLTDVEWDFEGEKTFSVYTGIETHTSHKFKKPGKYIVVVRTFNERHGNVSARFTKIRNIDRITVTVK